MSSLALPTQLLERHWSSLDATRLLIVEPPEAVDVHALCQHAQSRVEAMTIFTSDARTYHAAQPDLPAAIPFHFDVWLSSNEPFDLIILYLPKGKARLEMLLAMCASCLAPGGRLWLIGHKKAGINSAKKRLSQYFGIVEKEDHARHCVLWVASQPGASTASLDDWVRSWTLSGVADHPALQIATLPGVFSDGRLDDGTRHLLEHVPFRAARRVLDMGCGAGILGAMYASHHPHADVVLSDVSALALDASRRTLALNGLTNARCVPSDGLTMLGKERFGLILSNPPLHRGMADERGIFEAFVRDLPNHLTDRGEAVLVLNRFRDAIKPLQQGVGPVEVVWEDGRYRVIKVRRS